MTKEIGVEHTTKVKVALGHSRQAVAVATTTLVETGDGIDETIFRYFPKEALLRLNECLDNPQRHIPLTARLMYLLRMPLGNGPFRNQKQIGEMLGTGRAAVHYKMMKYFPEFCPNKVLKEARAVRMIGERAEECEE